MSERVTRVLCLHGWRMNGELLRVMLADIEALWPGAQFHCPDAPWSASGRALPKMRALCPEGPFWEWWDAQPLDSSSKRKVPSLDPKEDLDSPVHYVGWRKSVEEVEAIVRTQGPFELLIGYSQGGTLATVLTDRAEREIGVAPWRGVVLLNSGSPPREPLLSRQPFPPLRTPSIHISGGARDFTLASQERMRTHWQQATRTDLFHSQGHWPPTADQSTRVLGQLAEAVHSVLSEPRECDAP